MTYFTLSIKILLGFAFLALVLTIIIGVLRTWHTERSLNQQVFLRGTVPNPLPDGLYRGTVPGYTVSWLGKKFNAANSKGSNIFNDGNGVRGERYPFITSVGRGLHDNNLNVLKIDYDTPGNPLWLRFLVDEIVEIAPDKYLGKLHARIIPGYPFALGYFELERY